MATREELIAASGRRYLDVPVPELNLSVRIQSLTAKERNRLELQSYDKEGNAIVSRIAERGVRVFIAVVVDAAGKLMFDLKDIETVREMDSAIIARVSGAAADHCGFGKASGAAADFEDASA